MGATWADVREWFLMGADDLAARDCKWEAIYLVVLFAAQARDMLPPPKTAKSSFILHHWAVMITSFAAFSLTGAFNVFAFFSFVLEWDSMWFNIHNLYPTSAALDVVYHITMAGSNILGLAGGSWFVYNGTGRPQIWARCVY